MSRRKTHDEFLEELKEKQYELFNSIEIIGKYVDNKTNILVKTKYGICNANISSMLKGTLPTIKSAINKHDYFIEQLKERNRYAYDNLIFITKYEDSKKKMLAKDKYGILEFTKSYILSGKKPTIHLAVDKTKYWIEKVKEVHGDRYGYSDVEYEGWSSIVNIYCNKHGEYFKQKCSDHLSGCGCPKCGLESTGWTRTNFINASRSNGLLDDCILYVINCYNSNESFFKIGITSNGLEKRFYSKRTMPYEYKIIKIVNGKAGQIYDLEKDLHRKHIALNLSYMPNIFFEGYTECFKKLIEEEINNL